MKIKGGKKGFIRAVEEGFKSKGVNPTLRYSHTRGFHVESRMHPPDEDVIFQMMLYYHAGSGRRSVDWSDYGAIREEILGKTVACLVEVVDT